MKQILLVDKNPVNLKSVAESLSTDYLVSFAQSAEDLVNVTTHPDLILMDLDGLAEGRDLEFMLEIQKDVELSKLPVIVLSGKNDPNLESLFLSKGAMDFIIKPYEYTILKHRLELHLSFSQYQLGLENTVMELEDSIVTSFGELIECRDENTGGHVKRTSTYVALLGQALIDRGLFEKELSRKELDLIVRAAPLHDIGKIGVSDLILMKRGKLEPEEYEDVKKHTIIGRDVLTTIYESTPTQVYLRYAILIAGGHHERYDGGGYPEGLAGDNIPLCNRLMAVANVYDAMVTDRVYRLGLSHETACEQIVVGRGLEFDSVIVDTFIEINQEFKKISGRS